MEYLSYQPDRPPPPCLSPDSVQLSDPDTARLLVAPDSEQPKPNCPLRIAENTPTGDRYEGQVLGWRWEGLGTLTLPSGVRYEGQLRDGRFHGTGTLQLHFPTGSRYEGQWERGVCVSGLYTFADGLSFSDRDWKYCQYPDRRYWSEIQHGIRPAGRSQVTDKDDHPGADVAAGLYDAGDGVYDPKCRTVYDYGDRRKIKRVVTDDDHQWIMSRCRRGGDTFMGRREELHQDLSPLTFHGRNARDPPALPEKLRLYDIIGVPEPPPPSGLAPPPFDPRERSAELVREAIRSAQRVATSVRSIVASATGRVSVAEEEARRLVREAEERADSTGSTVSSLMEEARRRLGSSLSSSAGTTSSSGSGSDWSSTPSGDELSAPPTAARERRVAHAAVENSSSGESLTDSRAPSAPGSGSGSGSAPGSGSGSGGSGRQSSIARRGAASADFV